MTALHGHLLVPAATAAPATTPAATSATALCGAEPWHHRLRRWAVAASLASVAALLPGLAQAQVPPTLFIDDASVFEGNTGTRILRLPVRFVGPQPNAVTGTVSVIGLSGASFNPATGGAACAAGIDFVQFTNVPFTIPPNTPNGTLSVNITICGDAAIEPNEQLFVSFSNVFGAQCFEGTCNALAALLNDDGPPAMSINNISVSEPVVRGAGRTASLTVSLAHPTAQAVSVTFTTRNGTALAACIGCTPAVIFGDYNGKSGTLTIAANALSGTIDVTVLGDQIQENSQNFFVDLSAPVNATIADAAGQVTILDTTLSIGGFELSPDNATVQVEEQLAYSVHWTVPDNLVWRNLKSIDLRLRGGHGTALWVRWDESSNRFSLCQAPASAGKGRGADDDSDDDDDDQPVPAQRVKAQAVCAPGELPGSSAVLSTALARLHLADSTVTGSGPTGQAVTLKLVVSLLGKSAGHTYKLELAAADDFGNEDSFVRASKLSVVKPGHRRPD